MIAAWEQASGLFCLNAAPARPVAVDPDLTVVNRFELEALARRDGLVALTLGAEGAVLLEDGEEVARAVPPPVEAVDGTAAGDAFTACLLVSLLEGRERGGGARAARARPARSPRRGSGRSLPSRPQPRSTAHTRRGHEPTPIILDCDPGHDDAIALLLALASPELELLGVTTVARQPDAREDDRERAPGARPRRRGRTSPSPRAPTGRSSAS